MCWVYQLSCHRCSKWKPFYILKHECERRQNYAIERCGSLMLDVVPYNAFLCIHHLNGAGIESLDTEHLLRVIKHFNNVPRGYRTAGGEMLWTQTPPHRTRHLHTQVQTSPSLEDFPTSLAERTVTKFEDAVFGSGISAKQEIAIVTSEA